MENNSLHEQEKETGKDIKISAGVRIVNSVIGFLTSMPLAVVLILTITILAMLSTLIPQGENPDFYTSRYPAFLSFIILATGFHHFFSSFLFFVPVVLFSLNLFTCTIERLSRELRKKIPYRFGPDIIHIGILVLIAGGLMSFAGRVEEFTYLGEGDTIGILDKYVLLVEKCENIRYNDGRPRDWISTISIIKDDKKIVSSFPVEVNKPLKFRGLEIIQAQYSDEPMLIVADKNGREYRWISGNMIKTDQSTILFHGINIDSRDEKNRVAVFEEDFNDNTVRFIYAKPKDMIGEYTIKELYIRDVTGLKFIIDPGFLPFIIGLILTGLGISVTFLQKILYKK
jgi:cytochrome c biogenesis protein